MQLFVDYENSLLALAASLRRHFGLAAPHKSLAEADAFLAKGFRNVVLLVFDGLGLAVLEQHLPPDAFLRQHLRQSISSVFPPTTTAATTTLETGLSPAEHGWLGWSLHFPDFGNVNLYPNTLSGTNGTLAATFHVARETLPYVPLWEQIALANPAVKTACISPFGTVKVDGVQSLCETVQTLCRMPEPHYLYGYWHQPDYDSHDFGVSSPEAAKHILEINEQVAALCANLKETLVFITADHGLVDVSWRFLEDYPDITATLARKPSIETRTLSFSVWKGQEKAFEKAFARHFGNTFALLTAEDALASGLFGPGTPHPQVKGFLGDYIAVATGNEAIDAGHASGDVFRAAHAGFTAAELSVPLCIFTAY